MLRSRLIQNRRKPIRSYSRFDKLVIRLAYSKVPQWVVYPWVDLIRRTIKTPERKLAYTNHLIMLSLHNGCFDRARKLEEYIQKSPELKSRQLYILGDFQPSDTIHSGKYMEILVDSRVTNLASFLFTGIDEAENWIASHFPDFQFHSTFFFMDGTGPSPFNANLGDVYLKIGHYQPVENDQEIVLHAIIHELIHMYLRNEIGFRICAEDFGIRKFFDEGFAQLCGFHSVNAYQRKLAHADVCASSVLKTGLDKLKSRITNWHQTIFQQKHFPLYQASLSFIGYLENSLGFDNLFDLFKDADCETAFKNTVRKKTGSDLDDLLVSWSDYLAEIEVESGENFFTVTQIERNSSNSVRIGYKSDYPLYPVKDILVYDKTDKQLPVSITGKQRYQTIGDFDIECEKGQKLNITIAYDDHSQKIEIAKCV